MDTKEQIILSTIPILARQGYAGTSMRKIATHISREPSIIYAHFADKETLLREVRLYINKQLDSSQQYTDGASASLLLRETLRFQFQNRDLIVALLQYFMASQHDFDAVPEGGYVPARAYAHMERVIRQGVAEEYYASSDIGFDAKLTTHLVNGFLMEYFDRDITTAEQDVLVERLATFIEAALRSGREVTA